MTVGTVNKSMEEYMKGQVYISLRLYNLWWGAYIYVMMLYQIKVLFFIDRQKNIYWIGKTGKKSSA